MRDPLLGKGQRCHPETGSLRDTWHQSAWDKRCAYDPGRREREALEARNRVTDKWCGKYPNAMKSWERNCDSICPIFKFSADVRRVIYTTNAIESLNSTYRRLNRQRSVFSSDTALLKALSLSTFEATKKWSMPVRNWKTVLGELTVTYEGRLPE